jgi:hypothetical protein
MPPAVVFFLGAASAASLRGFLVDFAFFLDGGEDAGLSAIGYPTFSEVQRRRESVVTQWSRVSWWVGVDLRHLLAKVRA